jgi:uncharacterized protein (DUF1015 family)
MEIRPFRGWRYHSSNGDVSRFIAPPYDILNQADKDRLLARSDHNIVAVDLPHVPPKDLGPQGQYDKAAATLRQWQHDGVLVQEELAAIYAYQQTFTWAGRSYTRKAILAGVRATELGKDVIPHEHTFAGPKADRLCLTQKTGMQLSPIFGFYDEPTGAVAECLAKVMARPADVHALLEGVQEKLWVIRGQQEIEAIAKALSPQPVFIADGHHRYTTALNYIQQLSAGQDLPPDHPARFVLFALVQRDDPGLRILPTHRIIRQLKGDFSLAQLVGRSSAFEWRQADYQPSQLDDADAFLSPFGAAAMGFIQGQSARIQVARLKDPSAMAQAAPQESPVWRQLDVAILHQLIVERALAPWRTDATQIDYTPRGGEVLSACRACDNTLGVILQSTPLEAVVRIARAGASMPHKSTYFYPKLATGLVLKPLA